MSENSVGDAKKEKAFPCRRNVHRIASAISRVPPPFRMLVCVSIPLRIDTSLLFTYLYERQRCTSSDVGAGDSVRHSLCCDGQCLSRSWRFVYTLMGYGRRLSTPKCRQTSDSPGRNLCRLWYIKCYSDREFYFCLHPSVDKSPLGTE
jgi:hypothetical protein